MQWMGGIWYDRAVAGDREIGDPASPPSQVHLQPSGEPRRSPEGLPTRVHVLAMRHGVDLPGTAAMPIPSAPDAVAESTPCAGGALPPAGTGVRVTPTEHERRRVGVRPDLVRVQPTALRPGHRQRPRAPQVKGEGLPAHRRHQAMTRCERQRRKAVTLLIGVRDRNDDVRRGLEAERDDLLTRGSLIPCPLWRRHGPLPTRTKAASPARGQSGRSVRPCLGPACR